MFNHTDPADNRRANIYYFARGGEVTCSTEQLDELLTGLGRTVDDVKIDRIPGLDTHVSAALKEPIDVLAPVLESPRVIKRNGYEVHHDWPIATLLSAGGAGIVLTANGARGTAFFEATVISPSTFIRGEGDTMREAENAAWSQYQGYIQCPGHEFEARNYRNGAGFCRRCNMFKSKAFTPEDLGMSCDVCGTPTYWCAIGERTFCEAHTPSREEQRRLRQATGRPGALEDLLDELDD